MSRGRRLAGALLRALVAACCLVIALVLLVLPTTAMVGVHERLGYVALLLALPVGAAWLLIVMPFVAAALRLLRPDWREQPPDARHAPWALSELRQRPPVAPNRAGARYGLDASALAAVALLGVVGVALALALAR